MKKTKITEGRFKGMTLVMETEPYQMHVKCPKCGWVTLMTFFCKDMDEGLRASGPCPECKHQDLEFAVDA